MFVLNLEPEPLLQLNEAIEQEKFALYPMSA